ncbi:MAG: hypothetical protein AAF558_11805 [Verrucomicrobiota bacterium]
MKTYLVHTTLPTTLKLKAENFQFTLDARVLSFFVEGREIAAFPAENIICVIEHPFGLVTVPEPEFPDKDLED